VQLSDTHTHTHTHTVTRTHTHTIRDTRSIGRRAYAHRRCCQCSFNSKTKNDQSLFVCIMDIRIQLGLRGQGLFCCSFVAAVSIRHPMYVCKHFESAIIDIKRWCKQRLRRSPLNSWQLLLWLQSPPHPSKEPDEIRANRSSSKAMRPFLILCKYCATVEVSSSDEELTHKSSGHTTVKIRVSRLKH